MNASLTFLESYFLHLETSMDLNGANRIKNSEIQPLNRIKIPKSRTIYFESAPAPNVHRHDCVPNVYSYSMKFSL